MINTTGSIPCRGTYHYFASATPVWSPCGCGEREAALVGDKWHVRAMTNSAVADEAAVVAAREPGQVGAHARAALAALDADRGQQAVLRVLRANQRAPAIGDRVRWDNPSTGGWIEGTLLDRAAPAPHWLAVLQVERGSLEYPARSIQTVGVDDECALRAIPQRQYHHRTFDERVKIDEAAFRAAAEQLRAEQLAVSTSSVPMDTAAIRGEFGLPPLPPDAIVVHNTYAGRVTAEQAASLDARSAACISSGTAGARQCPKCLADLTSLTSWLHSIMLSSGATTFVTCTKEECMEWALRVQRDAAAAIPVAKAPTPEQQPAIRSRLDEIRRSPHQPIVIDADPALPRPDGFAQSQVDAAKAVLLATAPKRGQK